MDSTKKMVWPLRAFLRRSGRQMPHVGGELQKCGSLSTGQPPRSLAVRPTVLNELAMYIMPAAAMSEYPSR